jgi:hypothetical protein
VLLQHFFYEMDKDLRLILDRFEQTMANSDLSVRERYFFTEIIYRCLKGHALKKTDFLEILQEGSRIQRDKGLSEGTS